MRQRKSVKIDDKEYTVKELSVQDMLEIAGAATASTRTVVGIQELIAAHLPKASDVTMDDLKKMTPSEIKILWEAFREVNSVFFGLTDSVGLTAMLSDLKNSFIREWSLLVQTSLKRGTLES
jgi:hypothetical protein